MRLTFPLTTIKPLLLLLKVETRWYSTIAELVEELWDLVVFDESEYWPIMIIIMAFEPITTKVDGAVVHVPTKRWLEPISLTTVVTVKWAIMIPHWTMILSKATDLLLVFGERSNVNSHLLYLSWRN